MIQDPSIITLPIPGHEIRLNERCWQCDGDGHDKHYQVCDICNGIGYRTTDCGKAILQLVEMFLSTEDIRPTLKRLDI